MELEHNQQEELKNQQEEMLKMELEINNEKKAEDNLNNDLDSKSKLPLKTKIKRVILVIVLLVLIPVAYYAVITKGFRDGWFLYETSSGYRRSYNRYFPGGKKLYKKYSNMYYNALEACKPIIYLYPQEEMNIKVKLGNSEKLICSYPKYENGWDITAYPDGTLKDNKTDRELYSLFWEGNSLKADIKQEGYVVKGENVAEFLEEKLEILGLNYKEAEEFIVYWLPKLEANKYNYIRFLNIEEINNYMPLIFSETPDTLIRVMMAYKKLDEYIEVPEQKLESPKREGFVVVEWGGTEIKD